MDKLKKFIDFLNEEEVARLKTSMQVDWVRNEMEESSVNEAAKKAARLVVHYYVGLDRAYIITKEQERRWHEIIDKAKALGIW